MHILVLGAAGMVGRKLTERMLRDGRLGKRDITRMTLQDVVAPAKPDKAGFPVDTVTCDFAVPDVAEKLIAQGQTPVGSTPKQLADVLARETPIWAELIKESGAKKESHVFADI